MSFTPPLPETYAEFEALVRGRSGAAAVAVVQRIRAFHAGTLAQDSKVRLQALYGQVLQLFSAAAGERPPRRDVVDALAPLLVTMTAEVPLYAATVARARLAAMHKQFSESLRSAECAPFLVFCRAHAFCLSVPNYYKDTASRPAWAAW